VSDAETLYEQRTFLDGDRLDSVRAYLEVKHYPNREHPPHVEAGFMLSEEGVGHFCLYDDRSKESNHLPRVREAASRIIDALKGLVHAIDVYEKSNPFEAESEAGPEPGEPGGEA
jgi:hypothetical protein